MENFNKKQLKKLLLLDKERVLNEFLTKYELLDSVQLGDKIVILDKSLLTSVKCRGI